MFLWVALGLSVPSARRNVIIIITVIIAVALHFNHHFTLTVIKIKTVLIPC